MINQSLLDTPVNKEDSFILAGMPHMARHSVWSFTEADMEVMTRFQTRTVSTIGTKEASATYANCIAHLAFGVHLPRPHSQPTLTPTSTPS